MNPALREHLASVHQLLLRASLSYDIWWVYKSKETRPIFVDTMNQYLTFFSSSIHAHFLAYVAAMYAMHETRRDTHNCHQLLKRLTAEPGVKAADIAKAKSLIAAAKPIWIKVSILRNEAFGHLASNSSSSSAFKKAAVKPDELVQLLDISKELLNTVRSAVGADRHAYNLTGREATLKLLRDLKALNDA